MVFQIDNNSYDVIIERKNNKNLYIRITEDLKIKITCPYLYTNNMINKIIKENEKSIIRMIDKQKVKIKEDDNLLGMKINVEYKNVSKPIFIDNTLTIKDDNMKDKWFKKKALEIFEVYLKEAYDVFEEKIPYPKLKVRNMKTRWGVCNKRDNSVTLNLELIKKDKEYLNYVIVHELSHFVHFNHSKKFWMTVEKYCPCYKKVRKELKY